VHLTSSPAIWYAARASGVAAYVVLTVVVCMGIALAGKAQSTRWPRFAAEDVHRFGGLLVGSLIVTHVAAIAVDSFLPFSLTQLLVPFTATYRPLWTGLGIAAAELLLALAITNHYRKRMPHGVWRSAHYLNFAVWGAASLHGMFAGTDRSATWLAVLYGVGVASVAVLLLWRVGGFALRSPGMAAAGAVAVVALPVLMLGPLQKNVRPWNAAKVNEPLTGQVIRNGTQFKEIVSFVGNAVSPQKLLVRADLLVSPQALESTSLQLEYLPSGDICRGRVTQVGETSFAGRCRLPSGASRWIDASWVPAADNSGVVGTIRLHA
jgi:sulfoxide reductase heme-binding subunit YedZ